MRRLFVLRSLALVFAMSIPTAESVQAQCPVWSNGFGNYDMSDFVGALTVFDDGSGSALYAAGGFTTAGTVPADHIARWDGSGWSPLGAGMAHGSTSVAMRALAAFDDGSGPALYAGGTFMTAGGVAVNHIAKWDGSAWSPLGAGIDGTFKRVEALSVFDDGSGPALYVGGDFASVSGVSANHIAKWDGSSWSSLAGGTGGIVLSLKVFDDGTGPALYAGGFFATAGGVSATNIAKWNGSSWSALGSGVSGPSRSLEVFDDGSGFALYAGGDFITAGGVNVDNVAKWDGSSWSPLGSGVTGVPAASVFALSVFDDGSGPALYAGGDFASMGGVSAGSIAKWDGSSWSPLGSGLSGVSQFVYALGGFDDGSGAALYVGGIFEGAGGSDSKYLAKWNGTIWLPFQRGLSGVVSSLAVFDDGSGTALYAGGYFTGGIARWNGSDWSPLSSGAGPSPIYVSSLAVFDDGSGSALYGGGYFGPPGSTSPVHVAKWNGSSWSLLGAGMTGSLSPVVLALAVFDDGSGSALYAAGAFTTADGVNANRIARWNGSSWSPLSSGMNDQVRALGVFDDGSGSALYAGGSFTIAGGVTVNFIAEWNGSSWSPLSSGMNGSVWALSVFDDGSGPSLYAGGGLNAAGGVSANKIAKWNGSAWSPLGSGMGPPVSGVYALAVFDDGSGPALYAAGDFTSAGSASANRIARWNGSSWSPLDEGLNDKGLALTVFDSGDGPALYTGGEFTRAGDHPSSFIAAWQGCNHPGERICSGDGTGSTCPCANSGGAGRGCENSAATGGASLDSSGWTSIGHDTLVLTSSGELPTALSIFLQGTLQIAPTSFGDGLRCAGGSLRRLYVKNAIAGTVVAPDAGDSLISVRSGELGDLIQVGQTRVYQVYYRDPDLAFCPPPLGNSWNVTNGLRIGWLP